MLTEWRQKRELAIKSLIERYYPGEDRRKDFAQMVHAYLQPNFRVLHAGCNGDTLFQLRGNCQEVVGVDIDENVLQNEDVDTPIVADVEKLTFPPTFDLVLCKGVVEHLANPMVCFNGFSNALKTGGLVIIITPNLLHYGTIAVKLTPHAFHRWYVEKIMKGIPEAAFPTYFRANRRRKLCSMMAEVDFKPVEIRMLESSPDYLAFSYITLLLGIGYERVVNRFNFLQDLRSWIMCVFQKR